MPMTIADRRSLRARLFAVLRSAEFARGDADRALSLHAGIEAVIADLEFRPGANPVQPCKPVRHTSRPRARAAT